MLFEKLEYFEN